MGVVYTDRAVLRVCKTGVPPAIGPSCAERANPVDGVVAYAQSERALHVTWEATSAYRSNESKGRQLLSGYNIIVASAGRVDVNVRIPRSQTNITFDQGEIRADTVYTCVVAALYDEGTVEAKGTQCSGPSTCSGSLPCLPSPTAVPTCGCSRGQLHTMGIASNTREWGCRRCVAGLDCRGGAATSTYTVPGWFAVNARALYLHDSEDIGGGDDATKEGARIERPSMFACPNNAACLGNMSVKAIAIAAKNTSIAALLYRQCADGYTGVLCSACETGHARGEHLTCSKCTVSRDDAIVIILVSVGALVAVIVLAILIAKRLGRAPLLERLFIRSMDQASQRHGLDGAITLLFGGVNRSAMEGDGLSYTMFVDALRPGGSLDLHDLPSECIDKEAKALWKKLDTDDGKDGNHPAARVPVILSPSPAPHIADSCTLLCPIRYALDALDAFGVNQHVLLTRLLRSPPSPPQTEPPQSKSSLLSSSR